MPGKITDKLGTNKKPPHVYRRVLPLMHLLVCVDCQPTHDEHSPMWASLCTTATYSLGP